VKLAHRRGFWHNADVLQGIVTRAACAVLVSTALVGCEQASPIIDATTALDDTTSTTGPYEVQTVVTGATTQYRIELVYSIDSENPDEYFPQLMEASVGGGVHEGEAFAGQIPGQPAGTTIRYFVQVSRGDGDIVTDPPEGVVEPYTFEVLE